MAKPQVDFQLLREIAECASGMRTYDLYFVIRDDTTFEFFKNPHCPPQETPDTTVIHVSRVEDPPRRVRYAQIGDGTTCPTDLMKLKVGPVGAHQGGEFEADAVFWSVSAVEKFLVPYYASVYGDRSPEYVRSVLGILLPHPGPIAPPEHGDVLVEPAFAIAHLPSSEYTRVSGAGVPMKDADGFVMDDDSGPEGKTRKGQHFVPHTVAIGPGGRVDRVPVHHHEAPSPSTNGSRSRYARMAGR
jgi:hypothetical protein